MFSVSRSLRRAPSSSARANALTISSLGSARRASMIGRKIGVERPRGRLAGLALARADHRLQQTRAPGGTRS